MFFWRKTVDLLDSILQWKPSTLEFVIVLTICGFHIQILGILFILGEKTFGFFRRKYGKSHGSSRNPNR